MMPFRSECAKVGELVFPEFRGVRVMMMPVRLDDADTLPIEQWRVPFRRLVEMSPVKTGTAYLTIDEALVLAGETHRRPGLHVDGIGPDGKEAGCGGGGNYGASGMLIAASALGCVGWVQDSPPRNSMHEDAADRLAKWRARGAPMPRVVAQVPTFGPIDWAEIERMASKLDRAHYQLGPDDIEKLSASRCRERYGT
jgi:hypothetical protein